jgi:transforming growth factor-beta-induced protein
MKTMFNNTRRIFRTGTLALIVAFAFVATSCEEEEMPMANSQEFVNIPATLDNMNDNPDMFIKDDNLKKGKGDAQRYNSQFKTLRAALDYTGLTEVVSENRLTVLAPTDEAFANLLNALGLESLYELTPEALTPILLYHVFSPVAFSGDLADLGGSATTANGQDVVIYLNGGVMFNDANVEMADIKAMNGVIHAIDKVLLPPSMNIVELALSDDNFSILVEAVIAADLVGALASGEWTIFAPTNAAFAALLAETGIPSLGAIPVPYLTDVLLYHAVPGATVYSTNLVPGAQTITTAQGGTFSLNGSTFEITDALGRTANIGPADLMATNGVIHVIDKVLLP